MYATRMQEGKYNPAGENRHAEEKKEQVLCTEDASCLYI
jgi:hypothetical protein